MAKADDDDEYVRIGSTIAKGGKKPATEADDDPDVAAGRKIAATTPKQPPPVDTPPPTLADTKPGRPLSEILSSPEATAADVAPLPGAQGESDNWVRRIAEAAKKGYTETNLTTAAGDEAINQLGVVGKNIINPIIRGPNAVAGLVGGFGAGAGQVAYELGSGLGTGLEGFGIGPGGARMARDFNALAMVAPVAEGFRGRMPSALDQAQARVPPSPLEARVLDVRRQFEAMPPAERNFVPGVNQLSPEVAARAADRPVAPTSPVPAPVETRPGVAAAEPPPLGSPAPAAAPITTAAQAKQHASGIYKAAEDRGGVLTPDLANKFIDGVEAKLPQTEAGKAVGGESPVSALVKRLQTLRDKPMTFQAVQEIDEALGGLIDKEYGVKGISKDGLKLQDVQHSLRDLIDNAGPGDITGGSAGFDALSTARKAWSQAMKMDDLERIQTRAAMATNPATSIKTQLTTLRNNPKRIRGYDAEEIAALETAAERGKLGSALHVFGNRLVPLVAGAAEIGTHGITAGLAAAGTAHLVGGKLRSWATTLQEKRLRNAMDVLGQKVPPNPLDLPEAP